MSMNNIEITCPYCNKTTRIAIDTEELYPHVDNSDEVYWVFDCEHCSKPIKVDFKVQYTPTTIHTYNEVKCDCCGRRLYEGLDSIGYKDLYGSNPTKFMLALNNFVFDKYNILCDKCHWDLCDQKLGYDRNPDRLKALIGFKEDE